jgi:hypothetical protein
VTSFSNPEGNEFSIVKGVTTCDLDGVALFLRHIHQTIEESAVGDVSLHCRALAVVEREELCDGNDEY